jgi:FkbM family methyltransferase
MTLAAARVVERAGHVYAFEPAPDNIAALHRHITWNAVPNVTVMPVAVSDHDGREQFGGTGSSITYRLGQGSVEVDVRTIAGLQRDGVKPPSLLKIDVEGAESKVLRGAGDTLPKDSVLLIAIHSREQYDQCRSILEAQGFRTFRSEAMRRMMDALGDGWSPDPDLLAIGPAREIDADVMRLFTSTTPRNA